jgi:hypothetical protein
MLSQDITAKQQQYNAKRKRNDTLPQHNAETVAVIYLSSNSRRSSTNVSIVIPLRILTHSAACVVMVMVMEVCVDV